MMLADSQLLNIKTQIMRFVFILFFIFQPTQQQLLAATSSGDIRLFNLFSGAEENSYQVHESYIYHMQVSVLRNRYNQCFFLWQ